MGRSVGPDAGAVGVTMRPSSEGHDQDRPDDFVQSVGRAVRVLEVVGHEPRLPVKAIARRCGLNLSTAYHLVRTLAYEGYLFRLSDGTYVIGEKVAHRYHELMSTFERPAGAGVVLRHLSERVQLSSYLGLLHDDRVTVVEVAECTGSPYLEEFEVGLDVSAHATALGKALLLGMPRTQRRRYLSAHELRPFTRRTCTDAAELERRLAEARRDAPVSEHGEFRDDVSCTAALVPGPEDAPSMAVVVAVAGDEVDARVTAEVALAARDLGAGVGERDSTVG